MHLDTISPISAKSAILGSPLRRWVITHYDSELREQQKLEGKGKKANGRIEHVVRKTDVPSETVKEEEQRKRNNKSI
jgi:hypothetical protein